MTKTVAFHEAVIQVAVKVLDGDRVADVQRFQLAVLADTEAEWQHAIGLIREQMAQAQEAIDGNSSHTKISESA